MAFERTQPGEEGNQEPLSSEDIEARRLQEQYGELYEDFLLMYKNGEITRDKFDRVISNRLNWITTREQTEENSRLIDVLQNLTFEQLEADLKPISEAQKAYTKKITDESSEALRAQRELELLNSEISSLEDATEPWIELRSDVGIPVSDEENIQIHIENADESLEELVWYLNEKWFKRVLETKAYSSDLGNLNTIKEIFENIDLWIRVQIYVDQRIDGTRGISGHIELQKIWEEIIDSVNFENKEAFDRMINNY